MALYMKLSFSEISPVVLRKTGKRVQRWTFLAKWWIGSHYTHDMNQFPHHSASPLLLHQKRSVYPCAVMCRWCLTIRSFLAEIEIPLNPVSKTHEGDHFNRPFYIFFDSDTALISVDGGIRCAGLRALVQTVPISCHSRLNVRMWRVRHFWRQSMVTCPYSSLFKLQPYNALTWLFKTLLQD